MGRAASHRLGRPARLWLLSGVLRAATVLLACAHPPGQDDRHAAREPAWLVAPPPRCASGFSGPTLDPGDAIRHSRRNALENLAGPWLGVAIDSELRLDGSGVVAERTTQAVYGVLAGSRIVAMGASRDAGGGPRGAPREVYALACSADADTPSVRHPDFPEWLLNIHAEPNRICVPAVGGPTRDPRDQRTAALRDGRQALAEAMESLIDRQTLDDGRGLAEIRSESGSTTRARALIEGVDELDQAWHDPDGRGPLAIGGVLYALVCVTT